MNWFEKAKSIALPSAAEMRKKADDAQRASKEKIEEERKGYRERTKQRLKPKLIDFYTSLLATLHTRISDAANKGLTKVIYGSVPCDISAGNINEYPQFAVELSNDIEGYKIFMKICNERGYVVTFNVVRVEGTYHHESRDPTTYSVEIIISF